MSVHHSYEAGACQLCDFKLASAHPYFRDLWPKLKAKFPLAHISCTFRNASDQELAYKQGRSKLNWPKSLHNKVNSNEVPCSRAIDLFAIDMDGKAVWSPYQFLKIAEWIESNKFPITCGVRWKKFNDPPHYELQDSVAQP
jgi:hypothetical protein